MSETDRVMRAKYLRERHVDVRDNDTFDMAYQRYLKNNPDASEYRKTWATGFIKATLFSPTINAMRNNRHDFIRKNTDISDIRDNHP